MDETFKTLLETKDIWIPALTGLFARFSATRPGHFIERTIKEKLKWLKAPESEKAFFDAFEQGIEKYAAQRQHLPEARAAVRILPKCIRDETSPLSLPSLLEQIEEGKANEKNLLDVASHCAVEMEDALVPTQKVATELKILIEEFLHKAFLSNPYFAQTVGFAELISVVKEIREELACPGPDLEKLQNEYLSKLAEKYDVIPMQGISPKIQNRTIGMRIEDIFIPLELAQDTPTAYTYFVEALADNPLTHPKLVSETFKDIWPTNFFVEATPTPSEATLGMPSPISLIDPELSKNVEAFHFDTAVTAKLAKLLKAFAAETPKVPSSAKIKTLLTSSRIVVKGDPGSGKSTLIRYIAWALAKGRTEVVGTGVAERVPLLIRAIEFGEALEKQNVGSLEEYLLAEAGRFAPVIKRALVSGIALILIDGLDEVGKPALRTRVKERTDDFIADPVFAANHIFVTTRIVGYERTGLTGRFRHFTITDLNKDQIQRFILNWYTAIERETPGSIDAKSESLQLNSAINANESIGKMARNPLLLTIIALIKWQGRTLPEQRVLLYDAAAQTLIKSWPLTQRRVEFDELFIREWLAPIALHILADRTGDLIDEYSLTTELTGIMQQLKSMTEIQARSATRELLDNISEHSGFLLPRDTDKDGNNLYGFLHQTFAEYLAAYYLVGRWEDDQLDLRKYAHDPYWREVFLLMAGHLGTQRRAKAGKFIEAVRNLKSSAFENIVSRDLLLACQILTDGTPAGPANIIESILSDLLKLWAETNLPALRHDIDDLFMKIRETEYAEVLARLATNRQLAPYQIASLARLIGARLLTAPLIKLLNEPDGRLIAAELLLESHRRESLDVAAQLAGSDDLRVKAAATEFLVNAEDIRGLPPLLDLLRDEEFDPLEFKLDLKVPGNRRIAEGVAALLTDDDYQSRGNAAALLAHWRDPRGIRAFVGLLNTQNTETPMAFFALVDELQSFDAETLHQLLRSTNALVQLFVGVELVRRNDPSGIRPLLESEREDQKYGAPLVSVALANSEMPEAAAALRERLKSAHPRKRLHMASTLAKKGDQSGIEVLTTFLSSEDPEARMIAVEGLVGLPKLELTSHIDWFLTPAPDTETEFRLRSKNLQLQRRAVAVLAKVKGHEALDRLIGLLDDKRLGVRQKAADILASRDEPEAIEAMKNHIAEFTKGLDQSGSSPASTPSTTPGLANSAYVFLKRHLRPNGELGSAST